MAIFIGLLLLNLFMYLLSFVDYYILIVKRTGVLIPIMITWIAFYVLTKGLRLRKLWIVLITVVILIVLIPILFFQFILQSSYTTIQSPSGKVEIVIEHRNATLGETNHFYNFYKKTVIPGVVKKLNAETVHIMTRRMEADDISVLGTAEWIDDKYVIFHSVGSPIRLELR